MSYFRVLCFLEVFVESWDFFVASSSGFFEMESGRNSAVTNCYAGFAL